MKSFLTGLLVFLFYAVLCVVFLSYTLGETPFAEEDQMSSIQEDYDESRNSEVLPLENSTNDLSGRDNEIEDSSSYSIDSTIQNIDGTLDIAKLSFSSPSLSV